MTSDDGRLWSDGGRAYMVCATMRTGSSLLCELLAGTGHAGRPDEVFHPRERRTALASLNGERSYLEVLAEAAAPEGVFGAKLLDWQRYYLAETLCEHFGGPVDIPTGLAMTFGEVKYVYLRRKDRLRQAVSLYRARHTRRWRDDERYGPTRPEPEFDADAIRRAARELTAAEGRWHAFFITHGIEPLVVSYESLAEDMEGTLRHVLDFLELPVPASETLQPPSLVRQADDQTEEWLALLGDR